MMRLVLFDLRDHAVTWIGAFAVAVTCGYLGGWAASLRATADLCAGTLQRNMQDAATMVLVFSLVAAVAVLVSAANLTVVAQRRSYALWQLANVGPRRVGVVVLAQLAVVAVVGAVVGTLLSAATFVPLFSLVFGGHGKFSQVAPQVGASSMPAVWLAVAGVFLCGGLKGARGAAKTPPLTALREPEPERRGMTWLRALLFVALAACAWWVSSLMLDDGPDKVLNWSLYIPLLMVAAMVPLAPLAFSAFLSAWTSLLPQKWNAWYLARRTARHGLSSSTSVETPIMVGVGLVAGVFSIVACAAAYAEAQGAADFAGLDFTTTILMLGGPVLLCAVGAAVSVVMTSRSRTRDVARFVAAGRPRFWRRLPARHASMPSLPRLWAWRSWSSRTPWWPTRTACLSSPACPSGKASSSRWWASRSCWWRRSFPPARPSGRKPPPSSPRRSERAPARARACTSRTPACASLRAPQVADGSLDISHPRVREPARPAVLQRARRAAVDKIASIPWGSAASGGFCAEHLQEVPGQRRVNFVTLTEG